MSKAGQQSGKKETPKAKPSSGRPAPSYQPERVTTREQGGKLNKAR